MVNELLVQSELFHVDEVNICLSVEGEIPMLGPHTRKGFL